MLLLTMHHIVSRRLVHGRAGPRAGGALRGLRRRGLLAACRSCPSSTRDFAVWQREMALRASAWRRSSPGGGSAWPGARRPSTCPLDRPRPPVPTPSAARRRPSSCRRSLGAPAALAGRRAPPSSWPCSPASGAARRAHRAGRPAGGHAHRQPQPRRGRGADRLLRQHPGAARRPLGRSRLPRSPGAGARGGPGRLRPPGPALRAARGGAAAGARSCSRTPLFQVLFALQDAPPRPPTLPASA